LASIPALRPYPSYKPSGVPWLGDVPEGWEMQSFGSLAQERLLRGGPDLPLLSVLREKGVVLRSSLSEEENHNYAPDDLSRYRVVRAGDLAINKMKAWQGSMGISPLDGLVSPAYFVYALEAGDRQYAHRLLRSKPYVAFYNQASDGVRVGQWDLSKDRLKRIPILLPPLPDQSAIVRYLDYVDRRIRKHIRAKQKLIALLSEQKQAIIHEAVTGRIDVRTGKPYPKYKPSGVPWLGDVPEGWGASASKRIFSERKELARPNDVQLSATQTYGVIPQRDFEERVGRRVVRIMLHLEKRRHVEKDDFVISMRSFQGGLERAWATGCIRSSYVVLKPSPSVHIGYFARLLKSYGYIKALQATANFIRDGQDMNFHNFCLVDLPMVPMREQMAIAGHIDQVSVDIDKAVLRTRNEIDLLREYRTRLVADVVTGKLDVREVAASLPEEEPEEAEGPESADGEEEAEMVEEAGEQEENDV
jgi:type I restriction enzyme S subunit